MLSILVGLISVGLRRLRLILLLVLLLILILLLILLILLILLFFFFFLILVLILLVLVLVLLLLLEFDLGNTQILARLKVGFVDTERLFVVVYCRCIVLLIECEIPKIIECELKELFIRCEFGYFGQQ